MQSYRFVGFYRHFCYNYLVLKEHYRNFVAQKS